MQGLISFIIPVRDRENQRIQNCVNSLQSDITGEIIIVDYGSKKPVKDIFGAKIIRYTSNKIWNKSHAINLGIKKAKYEYISTIDCDIILSPDFLDIARKYLRHNAFLYSTNVRRVELEDITGDFYNMLEHSKEWNTYINRHDIIHNANGGIQIYAKQWINDIGGADESLIYWGGMDNDIFERAMMCRLTTVNLNLIILHQEHKLKKEKQLDKKERIVAIMTKIPKIEYLNSMLNTRQFIRNNGKWGMRKPNQSRFLKSIEEIRYLQKKVKAEEKIYTKAFMEAVKNKKKTFKFRGKDIHTFR